MKKIYLVRHGESTANIQNVVQDGLDELTELGHIQAETLSKRLKKLPFNNLVVSDYVRTRQTVKSLLNYTKVEPIYSSLVREIKRPAELVGKPLDSIDFTSYTASAKENISKPDWHFSDEENFFDVVGRIEKFFKLVDELEGDTLVVSHGRFIVFVSMYVIMAGKLSPDNWSTDMDTFTTTNTGITTFSYKEHKKIWALTTYNDHAHFAE